MSTTTHSHIVPMAHPLFFILRVVQLVFAVVLLGLLAYLAWDYNQIAGTFTSVYSGAVGVGLFTVCLTIILGVYYFVSTLAVHAAYNKWAVVALEAAAALFWLITFALLADCVALNISEEQAASSISYTYCDDYGYCYKRLGKRGIYDTWNGLWDASLAFAVIEWILFMVTLVLYSLGLHKHRGASSNNANNANVAEQGYTPKQMEAGPAPAQPVPAPEYTQEQHVPQPTYEQQPMQQHPVQDSTPMH